MKRLSLVCMVILLLAVPVQAQVESTAELRLFPHIDITDLEQRIPSRPGAAVGCGDPLIVEQPQFQAIRFSETYTESGCAEFILPLAVPEGASRLTVSFSMDRNLADVRGSAAGTPNAIQTFTLRGGQDNKLGELEMFTRTSGSSGKSLPFSQSTDVGNETTIRAIWLFEDLGIGDARASNGLALQSMLHKIQASFVGVPLPITMEDVDSDVRANTVQDRSVLWVDVEESFFESATPEVTLLVAHDAHVRGLRTPSGLTLDLTSMVIAIDAQQRVVIPADVIALHGPGPYGVVLERTHVAVADSALAPLAGTSMFLPIAGAAFAGYQYQQVQKRAQAARRRTNGALRATLLGMVATYVVVLVFLFTTGEFWNLLITPLPVAGVAYLLLLVAIGASFVLVALVGARKQAHAIEQEVDDLMETKSKLERSNHDLEHFAYIASHDLQEPLRTISGFSQLLQRRYGDQIPEGGQRYLEKTIAGSQRMQQLIGDLLAYSRITTHGQPTESVDLGKIIDNEIEQLRALIRDTNAKIHRSAMPTLPGDAHQLGQVFGNLIRNAIKYHHPDRPPAIDVGAILEGNWWHITVSDNGVGIPEDQFERIFIIFQRLAPRSDTSGTGIGLSIVQRVVERHGGKVWLDSKVGQGSTFHIRLPAGVQHD